MALHFEQMEEKAVFSISPMPGMEGIAPEPVSVVNAADYVVWRYVKDGAQENIERLEDGRAELHCETVDAVFSEPADSGPRDGFNVWNLNKSSYIDEINGI